ncbi:MAG: hypothetical protein E6G02_06985 [Actinobacteria bacterium]|nr:MAG: hypothetical protein E6G02_06985 [Actinomycetota bacterium]
MIPIETISKALGALTPEEREQFAGMRAAAIADVLTGYAASREALAERLAAEHVERKAAERESLGDAWLALLGISVAEPVTLSTDATGITQIDAGPRPGPYRGVDGASALFAARQPPDAAEAAWLAYSEGFS